MSFINNTIFTIFFLFAFGALALGQTNPNSEKVKGEGRLTNMGKQKITLTELASPQRQETILEMERNEVEMNKAATAGDGKTSAKEEAILNHARQLRDKMK
jgi:hypothetical protein